MIRMVIRARLRCLGKAPMPSFQKTSLLESFIEDHATDYYYNDDLQALVVNRGMTIDEHMSLSFIYREDKHRDQLSWLYNASSTIERTWNRTFSSEEWEFLEKNKLETYKRRRQQEYRRNGEEG